MTHTGFGFGPSHSDWHTIGCRADFRLPSIGTYLAMATISLFTEAEVTGTAIILAR